MQKFKNSFLSFKYTARVIMNNKKTKTKTSRVRVKQSENAVKALLSFLLEHKEKVEELKYTRGASSNPGNIQL